MNLVNAVPCRQPIQNVAKKAKPGDLIWWVSDENGLEDPGVVKQVNDGFVELEDGRFLNAYHVFDLQEK